MTRKGPAGRGSRPVAPDDGRPVRARRGAAVPGAAPLARRPCGRRHAHPGAPDRQPALPALRRRGSGRRRRRRPGRPRTDAIAERGTGGEPRHRGRRAAGLREGGEPVDPGGHGDAAPHLDRPGLAARLVRGRGVDLLHRDAPDAGEVPDPGPAGHLRAELPDPHPHPPGRQRPQGASLRALPDGVERPVRLVLLHPRPGRGAGRCQRRGRLRRSGSHEVQRRPRPRPRLDQEAQEPGPAGEPALRPPGPGLAPGRHCAAVRRQRPGGGSRSAVHLALRPDHREDGPAQPRRLHGTQLLAERPLPGGHQDELARHRHRGPRRPERERAAAGHHGRALMGRRLVAGRDPDRLPRAGRARRPISSWRRSPAARTPTSRSPRSRP